MGWLENLSSGLLGAFIGSILGPWCQGHANEYFDSRKEKQTHKNLLEWLADDTAMVLANPDYDNRNISPAFGFRSGRDILTEHRHLFAANQPLLSAIQKLESSVAEFNDMRNQLITIRTVSPGAHQSEFVNRVKSLYADAQSSAKELRSLLEAGEKKAPRGRESL